MGRAQVGEREGRAGGARATETASYQLESVSSGCTRP